MSLYAKPALGLGSTAKGVADDLIRTNTRWLILFEPIGDFSAQLFCRLYKRKRYLPDRLTVISPSVPLVESFAAISGGCSV